MNWREIAEEINVEREKAATTDQRVALLTVFKATMDIAKTVIAPSSLEAFRAWRRWTKSHDVKSTPGAFYPWDRTSHWEKHARLEDISHVPREAYIDSLMKAADAGNWQGVDRLCDEECRKVLAKMRES